MGCDPEPNAQMCKTCVGCPVSDGCFYHISHRHSPTETARSARTSGSLAATADRSVETTVHNSPPFSGRAESLLSQTGGETSGCDKCQERYTFQGCGNCVGD